LLGHLNILYLLAVLKQYIKNIVKVHRPMCVSVWSCISAYLLLRYADPKTGIIILTSNCNEGFY